MGIYKEIEIGENIILVLRIYELVDFIDGAIAIDNTYCYRTYYSYNYSRPLEYKNLCKFLDTSENPKFLPRFKLGDNIHLDRVRSREIYDEIKDFFKPVEEKRDENIDKLLR
jgi:hypothetical protein